jgi:hypothetical protein
LHRGARNVQNHASKVLVNTNKYTSFSILDDIMVKNAEIGSWGALKPEMLSHHPTFAKR